MSAPVISIRLKKGREVSLLRRHPWVFSGAIDKIDRAVQDGDLVEVLSSSGEILGRGHYGTGSIAVKMLAWNAEYSDEVGIPERISQAAELRKTLGLLSSETTTGFRLVNAEGDGLPGLIVDLYGETAVLQFHSNGMARCADFVAEGLRRALGSRLTAIFDKSKDLESDEAGKGNRQGGYLWGAAGTPEFRENGLRFAVDWEQGQKTGFFLDQRDNRDLVRRFAAGRAVLNCFSYTGGFSIAALAGKAASVVSVDSSAAALKILEANLVLNREEGAHRSIQADCLQYLQKLDAEYDIIVLDPPAFIKHRGALRGGIKGYETINHLALKQIKQGGMLFTFSCSQLLSKADFVDVLRRAAQRAGREAKVLFELRQAACHPVNIAHPEGDYLKGLVLEIR